MKNIYLFMLLIFGALSLNAQTADLSDEDIKTLNTMEEKLSHYQIQDSAAYSEFINADYNLTSVNLVQLDGDDLEKIENFLNTEKHLYRNPFYEIFMIVYKVFEN